MKFIYFSDAGYKTEVITLLKKIERSEGVDTGQYWLHGHLSGREIPHHISGWPYKRMTIYLILDVLVMMIIKFKKILLLVYFYIPKLLMPPLKLVSNWMEISSESISENELQFGYGAILREILNSNHVNFTNQIPCKFQMPHTFNSCDADYFGKKKKSQPFKISRDIETNFNSAEIKTNHMGMKHYIHNRKERNGPTASVFSNK